MSNALRVVLLCLGTWLGSLFATLVVLVVVAVSTSHWSASRVGPAMLGVWGAGLLIFGFGSFLLWRRIAPPIVSPGARVAISLGHALVQFFTLGLLVLSSLVVFNR